MHWTHPPRILSEHLAPLPEPLACLLTPGAVGPAPAVAALGARALLDLTPLALEGKTPWPAWLAPHQVPAAERLIGILGRHGGALLADAVGLGKSYVALAVALALSEPFALVVPAVLVRQWRGLLERYDADAPIITHESLSVNPCRPLPPSTAPYRLFVVDEAHRFRNPLTNRYRALAKLVVGARVLLVTATPVHNRIADLFHLFRLFLRDHDLTALGVPSLCRAARGDADPHAVTAAAARLSVSRSRERVQAGYDTGPGALPFPERAAGEAIRVGTAPDVQLQELVTGVASSRPVARRRPCFACSSCRSSLRACPRFARASLGTTHSSSWASQPRRRGWRSGAESSGGCFPPDPTTCSSRSSRWSFRPDPAPRPIGTEMRCGGWAPSPHHWLIPRRTRLLACSRRAWERRSSSSNRGPRCIT